MNPSTWMWLGKKTVKSVRLIPGTSTFNGQVLEDKPVKKTEKEQSDRRKIKNLSWTIKQGKNCLTSNKLFTSGLCIVKKKIWVMCNTQQASFYSTSFWLIWDKQQPKRECFWEWLKLFVVLRSEKSKLQKRTNLRVLIGPVCYWVESPLKG